MKHLMRILNFIIITAAANCFLPLMSIDRLYIAAILGALFILANISPSIADRSVRGLRLRICADGCELLRLFLASTAVSVGWHIYTAFACIPDNWKTWLISAAVAAVVEALVFWNGIIRVYCTSAQLGLRWRVIGVICGWIPIANLWALANIISVASREAKEESAKKLLNEQRREKQICRTKYPLLLVHGVFFRDSAVLNYWGRIPAELERNGAQVYYGNHQSARAVADSGAEIAERIKAIIAQTGCEKVNIIAHSKGGLDSRYAVSMLDAAPYVASITTVNSPHRGCGFADYLLEKIPDSTQQVVASKYNAAARKLGDTAPDFMAAVRDLTAEACEARNEKVMDAAGIFYQSIGSTIKKAAGGSFPMNFTFPLVKFFDGPNDGLVSEPSFPWGEEYRLLEAKGKRGISHCDIIDLNRENLPDFDVREFYVQLVSDLRERGF